MTTAEGIASRRPRLCQSLESWRATSLVVLDFNAFNFWLTVGVAREWKQEALGVRTKRRYLNFGREYDYPWRFHLLPLRAARMSASARAGPTTEGHSGQEKPR